MITMIKLPEQCFLGTEKPTKEKFRKIENFRSYINKPAGGLWTTDHDGDGECDWGDWVKEEEFNEDSYTTPWLVTIKSDAKVLLIDSRKDYYQVKEDYGNGLPYAYCEYIEIARKVAEEKSISKDLMKNFEEMTGNALNGIDFEKIAKSYDVVRLTNKGLKEASFINGSILAMSTWDVQSCLILNWECIQNIREVDGFHYPGTSV